MLIYAPKRLKICTSNVAGVFSGIVPTWLLTNVSNKRAWPRSRDPVNFWALNANSSKMAEDTNFKFGRRVPRDSLDVAPDKSFRNVGVARVTWPRQHNSTVQTAAMGQIGLPRSTERILVLNVLRIRSDFKLEIKNKTTTTPTHTADYFKCMYTGRCSWQHSLINAKSCSRIKLRDDP